MSRSLVLLLAATAALAQRDTTVVRPVEIHDVLVNPGMGIQTFQRFGGEALYPTLRWSEAGPTETAKPAEVKPDFPGSSLSYCRWFWSALEPEPAKYRWDIIDTALDEARKHKQTLDIRIMPYDQSHPMPEWYQTPARAAPTSPATRTARSGRRTATIRCI